MSINIADKLVSPDPSFTLPKLTTDDFKPKNNYYVVTNGEVFNYYPIKVEKESTDELYRFEKRPPVILEGFAVVNKKVYKVPVADLLRGIIRKSREINLEVKDGNDAARAEPDTVPAGEVIDTPVAGQKAVRRKNERGVSREAEVEIGEAADIAWKDQMRSLLAALSQEEGLEEWEVTEAP